MILKSLNVNRLRTNTSFPRDNALGDLLGGYLVIVAGAAVERGCRDLRCRRSQMAGAHDTGLGNPEAKDQVVSPQRDVIVPAARRAGLLRIHWVTGEPYKKSNSVSIRAVCNGILSRSL